MTAAPIDPSRPTDAAILVEPYNNAWPQQFTDEAEALAQAIGPWIAGGIHHVAASTFSPP
jgi:GrpB-like predicted nucleotidyltransferase (UPF0157 family)